MSKKYVLLAVSNAVVNAQNPVIQCRGRTSSFFEDQIRAKKMGINFELFGLERSSAKVKKRTLSIYLHLQKQNIRFRLTWKSDHEFWGNVYGKKTSGKAKVQSCASLRNLHINWKQKMKASFLRDYSEAKNMPVRGRDIYDSQKSSLHGLLKIYSYVDIENQVLRHCHKFSFD